LGRPAGDEALDLVRTLKFDLVLLDLNLPDMTGIDVCRQVRAGFSVPIVVLAVRSSEKDKVAALDAGANDYVRYLIGNAARCMSVKIGQTAARA
jgi:two-component system, OmpR family, KDP operon response regulator KdpE